MERSNETANLFAALVKAQGEFPPITRTRTAEIPTRTGGKYEYKYADLGDMIGQLEPVLSQHGLGVTGGPARVECQMMTDDRGAVSPLLLVSVDTVMVHTSGEWMSNTATIVVKGLDAQAMGSAITYARRYGYGAICGVAPEDDDDARMAMGRQTAAKATRTVTRPVDRAASKTDPGDYVFPIDKRYKGQPIREVPVGYLRTFIMGAEFDKEDIRKATQAYLDTLATERQLEWLRFLAERVEQEVGAEVISSAKVKATVQAKHDELKGAIPRVWFEAAEAAVCSHIDPDRMKDFFDEFEQSGYTDPEKIGF